MPSLPLYTIAFHEIQFTAQVELAGPGDARNVCEHAHWFEEIVATRMLAAPPDSVDGIGFQLITLDGLKNVWAGFWHRNGKYASFILIKTRVR